MKELWANDKDFCQRLVVAITFGDKVDVGSGGDLTTDEVAKEKEG